LSINRNQRGIRSAVIPKTLVIDDLVLFFLSNLFRDPKTNGTVTKGVIKAKRIISNGIINASSGMMSAIIFFSLFLLVLF
jgi:hypothetical protein